MRGRRNSIRKTKNLSQTGTKAPASTNHSVSCHNPVHTTKSKFSPPIADTKATPTAGMIPPTNDTIPPPNDNTNDTRPCTHDSLSSGSLSSAFSDRSIHSCTTDFASNTPSRNDHDKIMTNRPPRDIPQVTPVLTIPSQDEASDTATIQHTPSPAFVDSDDESQRTNHSTSQSEENLRNTTYYTMYVH